MHPKGGVLRQALLLVAGCVLLATGVVGIVVPVLPTTPFLALAALCFARSSVRCHRWLLSNRLFGRYLDDYLCGRGVPGRVKAGVLGFLWLAITLSAVFFAKSLWLRILLLAVACGVTVHVLLLRVRPRETEIDEKGNNGDRSSTEER
jgi:uncharacterized membrane protein YbaN (DUF454 family)